MPTFSTLSFFFPSPLNPTSRFTFIHAHKCTPKTLFITSNNAQRHEHVLIRSSTYFIKAIDSEECFGGRGSVATISDSFWTSCSIEQKERKRRSHLYSKRCSRASSESKRERTTNDNAHQESTRYEPHVSRVRCGALEDDRAEGSRKS